MYIPQNWILTPVMLNKFVPYDLLVLEFSTVRQKQLTWPKFGNHSLLTRIVGPTFKQEGEF